MDEIAADIVGLGKNGTEAKSLQHSIQEIA